MKKSNPSKHIKNNVDYGVSWSMLANAPKNMFQRKVLERHYMNYLSSIIKPFSKWCDDVLYYNVNISSP